MKRFILMLTFMSVALAGTAQSKTALKERIEQWKSDMKEFRQRDADEVRSDELVDSLSRYQAGNSIEGKSFVMEAEAVTFKNGNRVIVNSVTNFISVKGDRGVVQISPSAFASGPNGMGGITVDGTVSGYEVKTDKKGVTRISMNISGIAINARVDITLYPDSNDAYAVVSPNFNSQTVRLEGKIVPFRMSRTVEGMSL